MNDANAELEDVRQIDRNQQVIFEIRSHTSVGVVGDYLGEGVYVVTDEDDKEHELHIDDLTIDED